MCSIYTFFIIKLFSHTELKRVDDPGHKAKKKSDELKIFENAK